jgi:hypothetical protein
VAAPPSVAQGDRRPPPSERQVREWWCTWQNARRVHQDPVVAPRERPFWAEEARVVACAEIFNM